MDKIIQEKRSLFANFAPNNHFLYLVGALKNLGQFGVPEHALDGIVLDITISPQNLDHVGGYFHGCITAEIFGHGGQFGIVFTSVTSLGRFFN